jgi:hypothetical protein
MLPITDYWMGRDSKYRGELTGQIRANADDLLRKVNTLVDLAGLSLENSPTTGSQITSGWRPAAVNAGVPGAAPRSKHMTGQAIDLYDPEGALDDWCVANSHRLAAVGLYLEHPLATKGWCHLQSVAPRSGNRIFYP